MGTAELKSRAKEQLRGRWGLAVVTVLVANIVLQTQVIADTAKRFGIGEFSFEVNVLYLFLGGVISTGLSRFLLNMATSRGKANFTDLFSYFNIYLKTLLLNIVITFAVLIGFLLLIIPGIIVMLMFSQAYYILAEDSSKSISQCLEESVEMMRGHKWDLFYLYLTFIGWWIVALLTFGIVGLWVSPYQKVTEANFYLSIKK